MLSVDRGAKKRFVMIREGMPPNQIPNILYIEIQEKIKGRKIQHLKLYHKMNITLQTARKERISKKNSHERIYCTRACHKH